MKDPLEVSGALCMNELTLEWSDTFYPWLSPIPDASVFLDDIKVDNESKIDEFYNCKCSWT